jgi:Holliday junction resolvase RusA-like endonuclease
VAVGLVLVEGKGPGRQSHATWRQAVATAARDWQEANGGVGLLDGDIALTVCFLFAKPASKPKKAEWANVKPDIDKLLRSVLDALTGVVLKDDARVVQVVMEKPYAVRDEAPGCWVVLEPVQRQLITPWMRKAAIPVGEAAVS